MCGLVYAVARPSYFLSDFLGAVLFSFSLSDQDEILRRCLHVIFGFVCHFALCCRMNLVLGLLTDFWRGIDCFFV